MAEPLDPPTSHDVDTTAGSTPLRQSTETVAEASRRDRNKRGKTWNVLAILAFVAALVASPLAALFGYLAVGQIRRSDQRGVTLAWIAVGLGWLWLAVLAVVSISFALIWSDTPLW